MDIQKLYRWEMETADGTILPQFNEDGSENTWKKLDVNKIVRVSIIPTMSLLPQHDVLIPIDRGVRFVRRFGRGFIRQKADFKLDEYVNCIVTNKYRFYVFHRSGRALVTDMNHEVYV